MGLNEQLLGGGGGGRSWPQYHAIKGTKREDPHEGCEILGLGSPVHCLGFWAAVFWGGQ